MDPAPFGKYLLLDRIAAGGMAEVFCAKTYGVEGFERLVAIKRILPNLAEDREFINMFVDEARIGVLLGHPNIVPVYELGRIDDMYYIAMEYVAGKDLRLLSDRLRKAGKRLPLPAAAYIICQICDGLDFAHRKADSSGRPLNLVHRDVSPQNILIGYEGLVKITDFGIAMAESRVSEKTQSGILKGKFSYMSPEHVRGQSIDRRADVFAVGILLYELVLGRRLFYSKNDLETLELVRDAEIPPPREIDPGLPAELEAVMLKALASDPEQRYSSAAELHDDLQRYLIVDQSIYSAKTLARYMEEEFAQEMAASTAKLEALMQAPAPHAVLLEARSGGSRSARPAPVVHSGGHDVDTPLPQPVIDGGTAGGEQDEITDQHTVVFASDAAGSVADDDDVPLETLYQDTNVGHAPVPMDDPDSASSRSAGPSAGARRRQSGRRPAQSSVTAASPIESHPTAALDAFEESVLDEGRDAVTRGPRDRSGLPRVERHVERRDPSDRRTADRRARPRSGTERRGGEERRLSRGVRPPSRGKHTRNIALVVSGVALAIVSVAFIAVLRMPEKPSSLVVTSAPISRVEISVDGKVVGNHTPFSTVNLTPGEHTLVLTAPGYVPNVRTFTITPGKAQVIAVDLEAGGVGPGAAGAEVEASGAGGAAAGAAVAAVADRGPSRPLRAAAVGDGATAAADVPKSQVPGGSPDSGAENAARRETGDDARDDGDTSAAVDTQPGGDREHRSGAVGAGAAEAGAAEGRAVDVGVLTVHSRPAGAHIWYRGKDHGRAPQTVAVERGTEATVGAHMPGYTMTYAKVLFRNEKSKSITITLHGGGSGADASDDDNGGDEDDDHGDADDGPTASAKPADRSPAPTPAASAAVAPSPGACDGSGAFLSVSAPGASNCTVTVGGRAVGTAPMFKRASPAGRCKVSVVCEGGKHYEQTTTLAPGASEKVIIRDDMWQ